METKLKEKIELNLTGSNDIIFKAIMLQHPNCLKAIMETLMNKKIKEIKILNSELPKRQFIEKGKRLDAYLESSDEYIDVEVSTSYNETIKNRNLSYVCHIYCNAVKKGENYSSYKKASIFNLVWGEKGQHFHTTGRLTDEYGNIISDMLSYHTFHMDNYMERYYNEDIKFILDYKYLIMLRLRLEEFDKLIELTGRDEIVEEYKEALEEVTNDYEIAPYIEGERDRQMLYDGIVQEKLEKALKEATEKVKKESIKEGREKGIKEGRKEGRKEGLNEGMKKGIQRNQREIINKLFSKGMTIIEIADMLDIAQDTITSMLN